MAVAAMTATYPGDREATMEYIRPDSKMNRRYMAAGAEINTGKYETRNVLVHDIRQEKDKYTLDTVGFQLLDHESKVGPLSLPPHGHEAPMCFFSLCCFGSLVLSI